MSAEYNDRLLPSKKNIPFRAFPVVSGIALEKMEDRGR
jgi:hypothetical protein